MTLDRWDGYEGSVTKHQPTPLDNPEEPRTIQTKPQSFRIVLLLVFVDGTNNIACRARRYERVHSRSLYHLHTHSFNSLFIVSIPKGKEVRGRPPCYFYVLQKYLRNKISHLFKVYDGSMSNLISIK
jgi:hypothetical protein